MKGSGKGSAGCCTLDFSREFESNIWDYVVCLHVKVSRKGCDVLLSSCNVPAMASQG